MKGIDGLREKLSPEKTEDKQFFLDMLDEQKQLAYEKDHLSAVLLMLKLYYINRLKKQIQEQKDLIAEANSGENAGKKYGEVLAASAKIKEYTAEIENFRCFYDEPYFARMDLVDNKDGYNSYYIGKKGDVNLEIVDWRAELAKKYYQKSRLSFSINEYDFKLILRRAFKAQYGEILDMKNEYMNLSDYLTKEEIGTNTDGIIFDPYLKAILAEKKEQPEISDIIRTIQERQYDVIIRPERESFVLQGCAGSGKTMVLLHRLSYLMYNNEQIHPMDVLVLTPSDSFNAFMDELAAVLELEKVGTVTLHNYFLRVLKNEGVDIKERIDYTQRESEEYLRYIYSQKFTDDVDAFMQKVFDGIYYMFAGSETEAFIADVVESCLVFEKNSEYVKNTSIRVRRTVLGEIKEKKDGGLYYTKPFRDLMNAVETVKNFLSEDMTSVKMRNKRNFYKRLFTFRRSMRFVAKYGEEICRQSEADLSALKRVIEKEITDLTRYKMRVAGAEVLTYADRIERRREILKEIEATKQRLEETASVLFAAVELNEVLSGDKNYALVGGCENTLELSRYFYREIVRKAKRKHGMESKSMYESDAYAIVLLLSRLGANLSPSHAFVFIDEGQDLSANEYELLRYINSDATFNVFGDLAQNMTPYRGICDWKECGIGDTVFRLNQNYRNTNQIVQYVTERLDVDMLPIGFEGDDVVSVKKRQVGSFFKDKKGLKAVITSAVDKEQYALKSYNDVAQTGKLSKSKINLLTAYESKGLEFSSVAVAPENMSENERYIAFTRALKELAVIEG